MGASRGTRPVRDAGRAPRRRVLRTGQRAPKGRCHALVVVLECADEKAVRWLGRSRLAMAVIPIIVGIVPGMASMKLFQAADVVELTGLTSSQLREWSSRGRRNLIPVDVEPGGPGRHALYSWQTILVLRMLKELHTEFAVEIGAWAPGMVKFRETLNHVSFSSLWGSTVHFKCMDDPKLVVESEANTLAGLAVPLNPHLLPIANSLSVRPPDQLFLFPTLAIAQ